MSIVIITIPGASKQSVVARIQQQTNDRVALVVVQRPRPRSLLRTLHQWWYGPDRLANLYYGTLLRFRPSLRHYLNLFRARTATPDTTSFSAPVLETDDINSPEVVAAVQECRPTVLAVWGSTIISPALIKSATHAINLHMGCAPHYRGAIANQRAVERRDLARLGFTIHYINGQVDAGHIIEQHCGAIAASPHETFAALNDAAEAALVRATSALALGEPLQTTPQDISNGENVRLREWTPTMRYHVACILKAWHDTNTPPQPHHDRH